MIYEADRLLLPSRHPEARIISSGSGSISEEIDEWAEWTFYDYLKPFLAAMAYQAMTPHACAVSTLSCRKHVAKWGMKEWHRALLITPLVWSERGVASWTIELVMTTRPASCGGLPIWDADEARAGPSAPELLPVTITAQ